MAKSTGTSWRQWGNSTFHLLPAGEREAVCGQGVPEDARTTPYSSMHCKRCEAKATPQQLGQAEAARLAIYATKQAAREAHLTRNRAGTFTVLRCEKCGRQVLGLPQNGQSLFCFHSEDMHGTVVEAIEATGPSWRSEAN